MFRYNRLFKGFVAGGITIVLIVAPSLFNASMAGEYTPPGLYDVEYYELPNGLRVLLKERRQARSVSYRAVVDVGKSDYPCGRKETPHFLEHLLFTGTSNYSESELDDLVQEHGGTWNAYTYESSTDYELDIFSKHADLGLAILYEIITDSQITQENVDRSRDIIHREAGGRPSAFKTWYHSLGFGRSGSALAHDRLLAGTSYACEGIETADEITRQNILEAYERYYVGRNMALVVVGDFDTDAMKADIAATFGTIRPGERNRLSTNSPHPLADDAPVTSRLSPFVDSDALAGLAYVSGGMQSPDYYERLFIDRYLSDQLFRQLRIERGLSYSAGIERTSYPDAEVWYAYADTELDDIDEVVDLIRAEFDRLTAEPISDEALASVKQKMLLLMAQGLESNSDTADYYANSLFEIERDGQLVREEEAIAALTAADIQRVAKRIFAEQPALEFRDRPTMTYTQAGILLGVIVILLSGLAVRFWIKRRFR